MKIKDKSGWEKCPRPNCGYEWKTKVLNPKECPRCKCRLDKDGYLA